MFLGNGWKCLSAQFSNLPLTGPHCNNWTGSILGETFYCGTWDVYQKLEKDDSVGQRDDY